MGTPPHLEFDMIDLDSNDDKLLAEFIASGLFPEGSNDSRMVTDAFNQWVAANGAPWRRAKAISFACTLKRSPRLHKWKSGGSRLRVALIPDRVGEL